MNKTAITVILSITLSGCTSVREYFKPWDESSGKSKFNYYGGKVVEIVTVTGALILVGGHYIKGSGGGASGGGSPGEPRACEPWEQSATGVCY